MAGAQESTRCGGGERLASVEDLFLDASEGMDKDKTASSPASLFVLHSHFGGEDLQSQLRVEFCVAAEALPLLQWCLTAPALFTAGEAWRAVGADKVAFPVVAAILNVLEDNGFMVRSSSKK